MLLGATCFLLQGQRGGCNKKSAGGVTSPLSLNSFVFCGLSLLIGFPRADTEKSGETIATPPRDPLFRGGFGSPFGVLSGVLFRRLRRFPCSIFWSITTRIFTAPLWFGTTFLPWWR